MRVPFPLAVALAIGVSTAAYADGYGPRPSYVSRITQFGGVGFEAIEGGVGGLSCPVSHEHAVVLAPVKDRPVGGSLTRPILDDRCARQHSNVRPGRKNGFRRGRTKE